ncbi:MAG: hypothetical protein IKC72_01245 [Clostridia bacterium]|nr:hypothetical protein [Clostridia bacterium]
MPSAPTPSFAQRHLAPTPSCARHRQVSSSSEAKDLCAIITSVASEILHFVQNDSCGE